MRYLLRIVLLIVAFAAGWLVAKTGWGAAAVAPSSVLEQQFVDRMRNSVLVGHFTVAGHEEQAPLEDRYEISSVDKVGPDRWRFNTRLKYGSVDTTLPITVPMRWVDDTPMIMMTDLSIPPLGTFTVRVFFYGDRYAGTWQHGRVGGQMFGTIEKATPR